MPKLTPEFAFMKRTSIGDRVKWILITAAVGFGLQLFVHPVVGWFFVLAAALMGSMESKSNEPVITGKGEWQAVTVEEMQKARKLLGGASEVKSGGCAKSACSGCATVFLASIVGLVLFLAVDGGKVLDVMAPVFDGGPLSVPFVVDVLTFALIIQLGGTATAWEPPNLRTKFEQMSGILAMEKANPQLGFLPNLQIAKTKEGTVPLDCKLLVKIKDADPNFIGIQVQTSFNKVQSQTFPYTYCVLLAKLEFGLTKKTEMIEMPPKGGFSVGFLGLFADENQKRESKFARFHGSLIELKREGEVDITVVRQDTSPNRGYTTSPSEALEVFSDAYLLAKMMLKEGS